MTSTVKGALADLNVIEFGGIGPGPLCCALLADHGADVLRVDRQYDPKLGIAKSPERNILNRGRASVSLNLKSAAGIEAALKLIERADAVVESFRPGTMEGLGLGPKECLSRNPALTYARITGWGQTGNLATTAGHDINYLAISGVLDAIGTRQSGPVPPLNTVADMGGGAMFGAFGLVSAVLSARATGRGQTIDIAMVDAAPYLAMICYALMAEDQWVPDRESNVLDGGAPYYATYETRDGKHVAVGCIEPKFYEIFISRLGVSPEELPDRDDRKNWMDLKKIFAGKFVARDQEYWEKLFAGTDACVSPVLNFSEAQKYCHNLHRQNIVEVAGVLQPSVVPRFSDTPGAVGGAPVAFGTDTRRALQQWGLSKSNIDALIASGDAGNL